jgi:hypothetical protein
LLFAFGSKTTEAYAQEYGPRIRAKVPIDDPCAQRGSHPDSVSQSIITILDPENMWKLAEIQLCGTLGSAVADGEGQIYFVIENHNDIARFNASVLADEIRTTNHSAATRPHATSTPDQPAQVDLRSGFSLPEYQEFRINHNYRDGCSDLHALAVDTARQRLFAACANQRFEVMSTDRAQPIASLVIGPGVDAIAYDPGRNLIFTANGGGYGSVTVIRQTLNDDYTVVQNLPTMERARTMALDPSSGILYLVTDLHGADLRNTPANGIGKLTLKQVDNSFQVLVVGN